MEMTFLNSKPKVRFEKDISFLFNIENFLCGLTTSIYIKVIFDPN